MPTTFRTKRSSHLDGRVDFGLRWNNHVWCRRRHLHHRASFPERVCLRTAQKRSSGESFFRKENTCGRLFVGKVDKCSITLRRLVAAGRVGTSRSSSLWEFTPRGSKPRPTQIHYSKAFGKNTPPPPQLKSSVDPPHRLHGCVLCVCGQCLDNREAAQSPNTPRDTHMGTTAACPRSLGFCVDCYCEVLCTQTQFSPTTRRVSPRIGRLTNWTGDYPY